MNSVQQVIDFLAETAEKNQVIPPEAYIRGAEKINVLLQVEQDKLYELEQKIAQKRAELVMQGKTSAYAKIVIEATEEYKEARKQKALIERALEVIRLAKTHSRLVSDMARSGM